MYYVLLTIFSSLCTEVKESHNYINLLLLSVLQRLFYNRCRLHAGFGERGEENIQGTMRRVPVTFPMIPSMHTFHFMFTSGSLCGGERIMEKVPK